MHVRAVHTKANESAKLFTKMHATLLISIKETDMYFKYCIVLIFKTANVCKAENAY